MLREWGDVNHVVQEVGGCAQRGDLAARHRQDFLLKQNQPVRVEVRELGLHIKHYEVN